MNILLLLYLFIYLIQINGYYVLSYPFILGSYNLKSTNDPTLINKFSYLIINYNDSIKFKTLTQNGVVATKISRSGILKFIKKNNKNNFFSHNNIYDNDITMSLKYNNVNKYSYSILGIEIPEFRYEQITNYKPEKKIKILQKGNLLYVLDNETNYYYLFDTISNGKPILPYKEITLKILIITELFGFFLNFLLVHIIK
jgi:hypothetical protein